eukprot:966337-Rhodomonas_salina.1
MADGTTTTVSGVSTTLELPIPGGYREGNRTQAQFNLPDALAVTPDGLSVVVADTGNHRIRLVSLATGATRLLAGTGTVGLRDGPWSYAHFYRPADVTMTPDGRFALIADRRNDVVRSVSLLDGYTTTLVGSGITGFLEGDARTAQFDNLYTAALTPDGLRLAVGDTSNARLRIVHMLDVSDDCECNAGFTGTLAHGCAPCEEGSYKDTVGDGACVTCPATRPLSRTGSHSVENCTCPVGYTGASPAPCAKCPPHTFKDIIGSLPCFACPDNAGSAEGSVVEANCTCNQGFVGADGGPCEPCPANTYKGTTGPGVCVECTPNTVSEPGTPGIGGCLCVAGFTGSEGECRECLAGSYKAEVGSQACTLCPADRTHSPEGSLHERSCTCNVGYEGDGARCFACPAGKYKDSTGPGTCSACPDARAWTSPGATSVAECACVAGYEAAHAQQHCQPCAAGTYKAWDGPGACALCPPASYKHLAGPGLCEPCANNSVSPFGSDNALDCRCDAGFVGPNGG